MNLKVGWDGAQYGKSSGTFLFDESGMFETPERPKKETRKALCEGNFQVWLVVLEGLMEAFGEERSNPKEVE